MIKTVFLGMVVASLFVPLAFAEVRTIRETSAGAPSTWDETITVKDAGGSLTQTTEARGAVTVSRFDAKGVLSNLTVTKTSFAFEAKRQGSVVSYTVTKDGKTKTGAVNLGSQGWFASWEHAAQTLLNAGGERLGMIVIPEEDPGMNLSFEMRKMGEVVRSGVKTLVFESSAQGPLGMMLPKLKLWLSPDGTLVAQETLPRPAGTRPTEMKPVLQEVVAKQP